MIDKGTLPVPRPSRPRGNNCRACTEFGVRSITPVRSVYEIPEEGNEDGVRSQDVFHSLLILIPTWLVERMDGSLPHEDAAPGCCHMCVACSKDNAHCSSVEWLDGASPYVLNSDYFLDRSTMRSRDSNFVDTRKPVSSRHPPET